MYYTAILHDFQGAPLALTEVRGDWAWHVKLWKLQTWWNRGSHICHACLATRSGSGCWQDLLGTVHDLRTHSDFIVNSLGKLHPNSATVLVFKLLISIILFWFEVSGSRSRGS